MLELSTRRLRSVHFRIGYMDLYRLRTSATSKIRTKGSEQRMSEQKRSWLETSAGDLFVGLLVLIALLVPFIILSWYFKI